MTTARESLAGVQFIKAKRVAPNTFRVIYPDGKQAIRFHKTDIITTLKNQEGEDVCILNSGGWNTVTTKKRINDFGPVRIFSSSGKWVAAIDNGEGRISGVKKSYFFDGLTIIGGDFANPMPIAPIRRSWEIKRSEKRSSADYQFQPQFAFAYAD